MTSELRVTLPGPEGSADARRAFTVLTKFLSVLGCLEDSALNRRASRADERTAWSLTDVALGSLVTTLAPNRPKRGATTIILDQVADMAVQGFAVAEEQDGLPPGWDLRAASAGAELAQLLGLLSADGMKLELLEQGRIASEVTVTRHAAEHLQAALRVRRESIGSLIGRLDAISVHQRREAGLWLERTGLRVAVNFSAQDTEQVSAALGQRVEIVGRITRDIDGNVMSIKLRSIQPLPAGHETPPLTDLVGLDPDVTEGLDPADYLREIRGAS
ncbi:hypothetical protein ABZ422_18275 [Micromonospora zamorensis]|uniref:hypothetical protein n=1 Tax=Micromonospora TaxID=1873 RepID=UPI00339FDB5B